MTLDPQILREALDSLNKRKARNKYHAKSCTIDGHRFDSQREGRRYLELKQMEKVGEIRELEPHPEFILNVPVKGRTNVYQKVGKYIGDFRYRQGPTGILVIEDVKSQPTRTAVYRLKKRMVEAQYGIKIRET